MQLAEILFGTAASVDNGGVNFIMSILLEDIENGRAVFE